MRIDLICVAPLWRKTWAGSVGAYFSMPLRREFWKMVCATAMKRAPPRVWKKETQAVAMGTSFRGRTAWTTRIADWKPTPVGFYLLQQSDHSKRQKAEKSKRGELTNTSPSENLVPKPFSERRST